MTTLSKERHTSPADHIARVNDLIEDIHTAMFVTALPDGTLRSRPMATQQMDAEGCLWFFTEAASGKVHEIKDDQHVNIAYASPDGNKYVSVTGTARIVKDQAKIDELWSAAVKAWFPKGQDDPNVALIRVHVQSAEYWDAPGNAVVQLYVHAKSALTGQRPADIGDHGTVKL